MVCVSLLHFAFQIKSTSKLNRVRMTMVTPRVHAAPSPTSSALMNTEMDVGREESSCPASRAHPFSSPPQVAICTRSELEDFLSEAVCMKEFDHPNVMRLLGEWGGIQWAPTTTTLRNSNPQVSGSPLPQGQQAPPPLALSPWNATSDPFQK